MPLVQFLTASLCELYCVRYHNFVDFKDTHKDFLSYHMTCFTYSLKFAPTSLKWSFNVFTSKRDASNLAGETKTNTQIKCIKIAAVVSRNLL